MRAQSDGPRLVLLDGDRIVYANAATRRSPGARSTAATRCPRPPSAPARASTGPGGGWPACARGASRPSRSAPRSSAPTAAGADRDGRDGASAVDGDPRMAVIARDITDRVAQERELQRGSRSSRPPAAQRGRARPRAAAGRRSALLERSLSSDEALQEVAELAGRPASPTPARWTSSTARGQLRRAGADARRPRPRAAARAGGRPAGRARPAGRPADLPGGHRRAGRRVRARAQRDARPARGPRARGRRPHARLARRGRRPVRDEWSLVEALAQRIALAVDGALQYRERAHVAQTLQASLLPAALPDDAGRDRRRRSTWRGRGHGRRRRLLRRLRPRRRGVGARHRRRARQGRRGGGRDGARALHACGPSAGRSPSPAATLAALNDEMLRQRNPDRRFVTACSSASSRAGRRRAPRRGLRRPPAAAAAARRRRRRGRAVPGHAARRRARRAQLRPARSSGAGRHAGALHRRRDRGAPRPAADAGGPRGGAARQRARRRRRRRARGRAPGARRRRGALRDDLAVLVVALDAVQPSSISQPPSAAARVAASVRSSWRSAPAARSPARGRRRSGAPSGSCDGPARRRARARGAGRSG